MITIKIMSKKINLIDHVRTKPNYLKTTCDISSTNLPFLTMPYFSILLGHDPLTYCECTSTTSITLGDGVKIESGANVVFSIRP